jgi:hypothetical protein
MSKFLSAGESFTGKECTWVDLLIRGGTLRQNSTYPTVRGVQLHNELDFWIGLSKARSGGEAKLEFQKCCLCLRSPVECSGGGGESGERCCQMAVVVEETSVKM